MLEQAIDLETPACPAPAPTSCCASPRSCTTSASRAPAASTDDGAVTFHHHEVVGAKMTAQADEGAALRQGRRPTQVAAWSSCTCASTGTATASGPTPPYAATSATPATSCAACTSSPAPTARPATAARPSACAATYDELEQRIARLSEQEELAAIRPDLDGNQIMEILGIPAGRDVGRAYRLLLGTAARAWSPRPEERAERRAPPLVGRPHLQAPRHDADPPITQADGRQSSRRAPGAGHSWIMAHSPMMKASTGGGPRSSSSWTGGDFIR